MENDYESLEQELRELLKMLDSFNESEQQEVRRFLDVGEYGLALETAVDIAVEESKVISDEAKMRIGELAKRMEISDKVDIGKLR